MILMYFESWSWLFPRKKLKCPFKVKPLHFSLEKRQLITLPHASSSSNSPLPSLAEYISSDPTHAFSSFKQTSVLHCRVCDANNQERTPCLRHVTANPAKHECSNDFQLMSAGGKCSVKSSGG